MENETAVVIRPEMTPGEVVTGATTQAKLLMNIVEQTKCYQQIRDKKYLQVEAWETIGAFNRVHAETQNIEPILKEGEIIGYQAQVQLWKDGQIVGGAVMPCFFTENACKGKEGDAKHKASMSAAQTFATSKAYRMNYSYVAILAGFQATPAEEMDETREDKTEHWCQEHDTQFFMKGRMKSYAHPVEGTDPVEWCHEHTDKPEPDLRGEFEKEGKDLLKESTDKAMKVTEETKSPIDLDWLKEQLGILQGKKLEAWTNANVIKYLNSITGSKATTVTTAVKVLNKEQVEKFVKKITDTVEMA